MLFGGPGDGVDMLTGRGHRLLDEHVTSGSDDLERELVVHARGYAEIDGIEIVARQKFVDTLVRSGYCEDRCECARS